MKNKLLNNRFLVFIFFALFFGIVVARKLYAGDVSNVILVVSTFVFVAVLCILYKKFVMIAVLILSFFCGNGLFFLTEKLNNVDSFDGECAIVGRVADKVSDEGNYYSIVLQDVSINGNDSKNVQLNLYKSESDFSISPGQNLSFSTTLEKVKYFEYGSLNTYYNRNNIGYSAFVYSKAVVIVDGSLKIDERYRLYVKNKLLSTMDEDYASICYAVLFGDKSDLSENINEDYKEAGIIHILTVSGLHVGFLIALLYFILKLCKANKYINFFVIFAILLIYCFLCGFSPSVVRASIMGIVMLLAKLSGNEYDSLTSLSVAGLIIIIANPFAALDVGFQMSFFCVFAIFMLYPILCKIFNSFLPKIIAQYISISLSAQLGILPFVAGFSQNLNFLSVFANLIVVPMFGIVYPLLFIAIIITSIMPFLDGVLVIFEYCFIAINFVAKFFAYSPLKIKLQPWKVYVSALYFVGMFLLSRFYMADKFLKLFSFSLTFMLLAIATIISMQPNESSSIDVIRCSYAQSIVLTNSSGEKMLVGDFDEYNLNKYLQYSSKYHLDYFCTENALTSQQTKDFENFGIEKSLTLNGQEDDKIIVASANDKIVVGSFEVNFIKVQEIFVGIEIFYDEQKIFFASSNLLSYNEVETVKEYFKDKNYSLVVLKDNFRLVSCFDNQIIISYDETSKTTYSYEKNGNFSLYGEKDLKFRSLD